LDTTRVSKPAVPTPRRDWLGSSELFMVFKDKTDATRHLPGPRLFVGSCQQVGAFHQESPTDHAPIL